MDIERALKFAAANPRAVLATRRRNGDPQMSPVVVAADGSRILISTRETAIKARNLRRDPHAWLCVFTDGFFGQWVQLAGDVEIVSLPDAMDLLVDYYRLAAGEHPNWDEYRAAMAAEQRCVIVFTPTGAGPTVSG